MIVKVYIVRCSHCQAPLRDSYGMDHRPKYFYQIDGIVQAMKEANWGTVNGMEICSSCFNQYRSSEL